MSYKAVALFGSMIVGMLGTTNEALAGRCKKCGRNDCSNYACCQPQAGACSVMVTSDSTAAWVRNDIAILKLQQKEIDDRIKKLEAAVPGR